MTSEESWATREETGTGDFDTKIWRMAVSLGLLSGAAALGHQLLWTRRMIDLLGAGAESTSRVFGVFFLGLALGGAAAYLLVRRIRSPWLWLAGAEIAILLLALPIYLLPAWSGALWPWLGPEALAGPAGAAVRLLLSVLLLLPPAFLMGWFLPVMAAALLDGRRTLQRHGVRLYAWNTLGGVAGLGLTAGVTLPVMGAPGAFVSVVLLNAVVAAGCWTLHRRSGPMVPARPPHWDRRASRATRSPERMLLMALAFLSGFGILALEVAFLEMLMLVAPLSFYAPAGVLFCVILLLALAAFLAGSLQRRIGTGEVLVLALAGTAAAAAVAPLVFFGSAYLTGGLPPSESFSLFLLRLILFAVLVTGPAFLCAGLVFPVITARRGRTGDPRGTEWGMLLAVNGVGGLAGAELTYRFLFPRFGLYGACLAVAGVYAGAAFLVAGGLIEGERRRSGYRIAAIGVAAFILLCIEPVRAVAVVNPFMRLSVLEHWSGREGTLAVVERPDFGRGLLSYNQYMLGTTAARHDQARQAHLPLILHPNPKRAAFIGMATGITPGAALLHTDLEEVISIELSSMVATAAEKYFVDYQNGLFSDPRSRVVVEDGRTYIVAGAGRFDVVAGDLFLPWGPGEARLYSVEHFRAVRESLKPGGLFCQWLALYQLRPEDLEIILRTFGRVFPETHLFVNGFGSESPSLAVVGFAEGGGLDWETVGARTREVRDQGRVRDLLMRHRAGLELLYLGQARTDDHGPVHTLNNMLIELAAGRERVTGNPSQKYLSGVRWESVVAERRESMRGSFDSVSEEMIELATLLTERGRRIRYNQPLSAGDERRISELFPSELRDDRNFDPIAWPGTLPPALR